MVTFGKIPCSAVNDPRKNKHYLSTCAPHTKTKQALNLSTSFTSTFIFLPHRCRLPSQILKMCVQQDNSTDSTTSPEIWAAHNHWRMHAYLCTNRWPDKSSVHRAEQGSSLLHRCTSNVHFSILFTHNSPTDSGQLCTDIPPGVRL